jgi:hypothetical protein
MMEIWKDVVGFEDSYQVSNIGNCRSKDRRVSNHTGIVLLRSASLTPNVLRHGYIGFTLSRNNKRKHISAHRLVALAFIPNPNNYPEVNHLDGVKTNNNVNNLEWTDRSGNMRHADRTGLRQMSGELSPSAKLNTLQVRIIRRLSGEMPQRCIAKIFNIAHGSVGAIVKGRKWKSVPSFKRITDNLFIKH